MQGTESMCNQYLSWKQVWVLVEEYVLILSVAQESLHIQDSHDEKWCSQYVQF